MPELPEVETTRLGIAPHLVGQRVQQVSVRRPRLRWPIPTEINALLSTQIIDSIVRRGKYLLLNTARGTALIHLGMSGSLRIFLQAPAPGKHDHFDIILTNGVCLRFNDPRCFGCLLWTTDVEAHPLLRELGPEPLSSALDSDYLFNKARGRAVPIKSFIMDSRVVVGVGNIYANEALFYAGIHPSEPAGRINHARYFRLVEIIKLILARSIKIGGTTLRNFTGGDGQPGYFKQCLRVYGRAGLPCQICTTDLIEIRLGQRSTVYCTQCQPLRND